MTSTNSSITAFPANIVPANMDGWKVAFAHWFKANKAAM